MKRVLIVSPYFAPSNAADMQRVRMSLPYFKDHGWEAEIVSVDPAYSDLVKDQLFSESIPEDIIIHYVNAFSKKRTRKFGLGSIALRSLWFYTRKVNHLLKRKKYDLIYFSTTQFPICILGAYWKKKFDTPYVIDVQDPWHSEYYQDKPKDQRPPKYWFSYRLNKWLEPIAMNHVDGLISVSQSYINDLKSRYPNTRHIPASVITFGASQKDFDIANDHATSLKSLVRSEAGRINIVYVGRGGHDMIPSITLLFAALARGICLEPELFNKFRIYFIGTSYAAPGHGIKTIQPLAKNMGLNELVIEVTDRISYYESIATLQKADILFIPGSDDEKYTASKLYPYLVSLKPLLAIFHKKSSAVDIIKNCSPGAKVFTFPDENADMINDIYNQLWRWSTDKISPLILNNRTFNKHSDSNMTSRQVAFFERVLTAKSSN